MVKWVRGRPRGVVNEQWLSNSEGSSVNSGRKTVVVQEGSSMNSGRQTVVMNSGRPIGVVQEGSSNSGHEQWSSLNSGRPWIGVVHEQWSSNSVMNSGRPWGSSKRGRQTVVMNRSRP